MANCTSGWQQIDGLRVASVGSADARRNVLTFMGLRACIDLFELHRFAVLAREWDARVTVVDTPGFGYGGARLSRRECAGLRRGDFTEVARRMVRTAAQCEPRVNRRPVTVVGYSLGTSIAAAAAADPGLVRVDHMMAVEPVALRVRNPLRLLTMALVEDSYVADYRRRDHGWCPADPASVPVSRGDLARLGYGLSRGTLTRDLLRAARVQRFALQIVHGRDSVLSAGAETARLANACRRAGLDVYDVAVDGRHAVWQSFPDVVAVARETRKRWTY